MRVTETAPLVDIIMPTYNHEHYIGQAIESVLAQETNFKYRLTVGDDCSTDDTQNIVKSYAEKHPDLIQTYFSPVNLGALHRERVGLRILSRCTAKYVTVVEGDDYWTDPRKLQKQVDFMESHPGCAICFHNALEVIEGSDEPPVPICPPDQKEFSTLADIAAGCFIPNCAALYRNKLFAEFPEWFYGISSADWAIHVLNAEHGDIGYIDEVMAVHRWHGRGLWSGRDAAWRCSELIKTYKAIDAHLNHRYKDTIDAKVAEFGALVSQLNQHGARACLDEYHPLARAGQARRAMPLLIQAVRLAPAEVLRPRRLVAVLKNLILGALRQNKSSNGL